MPIFEWNQDKNLWLQVHRGVRFEDIAEAFENRKILDTILHINQKKYPGQKMLVVDVDGYCYVVPYTEKQDLIFLKTIYQSRKATKKYIKKGK